MRSPYWIAAATTFVLSVYSLVYHPGFNRNQRVLPPKDERVLPPEAINHSETYSNILPGDYVGPETCAECHQEQYRQWKSHPHHCMNQLPNADSVKGDFDGAQLSLPTGVVRFTTGNDGKYRMLIFKGGKTFRSYEVTRTVGSRFMQFYVGRQTAGPEPTDHKIYREHMLPFAYWFKIRRWLPRQYFDPDGPEQLLHGIPQVEAVDCAPDVRSYGAVCLNCHNTFPYAYRIYQPKMVGFADATVSAAIAPLSKALAPVIDVEPTPDGFHGLNDRLNPEEHLVTLGISCESCHFGGREHALYQRQIRFLPTSKYLSIKPKDPDRPLTNNRNNASTVLGICVQCHSGSGKLLPNGACKVNSREGLDMHAGFCTSQLRCVDCHEPHTATAAPSGGPDQPQHVQLCTTCHRQYHDPVAALDHSGHPASANVNCLDCHMPRYTQGLDELIRTHRICMPVEESMAAAGSANACNLCHLDRSLRWTLDQLQQKWGRSITPKKQWASYDALDLPAGETWLHGDDIHLRLVATQRYAASRWGQEKLPDIIAALNDPEPINRVFAQFAVSRLLGQPLHQPLEVEITAPPAMRVRQMKELLNKLNLPVSSTEWPTDDH